MPVDAALRSGDGDRDYHDRVNRDLLDLLPETAQLIVECGCGTGALAAEYARRNPNATYVGIERDEAAGRRARRHLAQVEIGDAEQIDLQAVGIERGSVDCLVYGDVLEHLIDPWGLVARHAEFLSPSGIVLACVPNVQHWTVLLNLIAGEWRYEPEGLMDRTHLRWFTRESLVELFRAAGLMVAALHRRIVLDNRFELFLEAMQPALEGLQIDRTAFSEDARTLQYIVEARRDPARAPSPGKPPSSRPARGERLFLHHVITYKGAVGALNHHRIRAPAEALARVPGVSCCVERLSHARFVAGSAGDRVMIIQRAALTRPESLSPARELLRRGYVLVMDFDDHPSHNPLIAEHDYLSFRGVHAVQVTTEPLAALIRRWNPEVAVFPSAVTEPDPPPPRPDAEVAICFAAFNREADWAPIVDAVNRTVAAAKTPVRFEVVYDRTFFAALATERKSFRPLIDYEDYLDVVRRADIVLMPLQDSEFNRCKSDLKFLEASACGAVALASRVVYAGTIRSWENGVLFSTPDEFAGALARLIEDPALRRRLAQQAYRYVARERTWDVQAPARAHWYRSLVARRGELTSALLARVPELA